MRYKLCHLSFRFVNRVSLYFAVCVRTIDNEIIDEFIDHLTTKPKKHQFPRVPHRARALPSYFLSRITMLSDEELRRHVRTIRRSPRFNRPLSISAISGLTGISRMQLYRIDRGEPLGPRTRRELDRVFGCNVTAGARAEVPPPGR